MEIVCATDGHYLRHVVAMLESLWLHNPSPDLRVYLIFDSVEPEELGKAASHLRQRLPHLCLLQASSQSLDGFPVNGHATVATYFRLLLPELLPHAVERVIFVDADTVVTASLSELWDIPLQDRMLAAVPEHRLSCHDHGYRFGEYFNAGVMLIDLDRWRRSELLSRGREFAIQHPDRLRHWDQDILNHVFAGQWLPLADRWNACPHLFGLTPGYDIAVYGRTPAEEEAIAAPGIVHFAGPGRIKPWNALCTHPFRDHYRQVKALTPWASMPLDERPPPPWKQRLDQLIFQTKCRLKQGLQRRS